MHRFRDIYFNFSFIEPVSLPLGSDVVEDYLMLLQAYYVSIFCFVVYILSNLSNDL